MFPLLRGGITQFMQCESGLREERQKGEGFVNRAQTNCDLKLIGTEY